MLLVVNANNPDAGEAVSQTVTKYVKHFNMKSGNTTQNFPGLVVELRTAQGSQLHREVMALEGVVSASLLSHDGEVTF